MEKLQVMAARFDAGFRRVPDPLSPLFGDKLTALLDELNQVLAA